MAAPSELTAPVSGYRPGLVDLAAGRISREIFVNEAIYREEQERVFSRAWLFVGHESQIAKPGDFFGSGMGEEAVILTRDRAGAVHVFLNSCRHRGMKVCRYDEGNAAVFTCPYHGWSYATDGKLVGVPYFREAYRERLDKARWGLVEAAQICTYKETVWATWDPAAPPFLEYLGDFRLFLDLTLDGWDGSEGGTEVLGGVQKWLIPCNWKFPAENFSGDSYHNISHRSVDLAGIGPSGSGRRDMRERQMARRLHVAFPERGHQTGVYLLPKGPAAPPAYQHSAPAPHDRGVAPARTASDRGLALVPRRSVGTARGEELSARLLHPLFGPGRLDRAGRHGELELRACGQPRHNRAPPPVQLRAGARHRA
jgi:phenylpropionate dioxygenase-like ring-hydroxylating dioxygenase large terminal subunit